MKHHHVTAENIDDVREHVTAVDQRRELEPGCETWGILYTGGQRGQITVWPRKGRAAICFGGDSDWGDWDPNARTIHVDNDGGVYGEDGEKIEPDPDC